MVREGWPWNGHFLLTHYTQALQAVGGLPVILPLAHVDTCEGTLSHLDGLMITGGLDDVPPQVLAEAPHPSVTPMPMERWDSECLWLGCARRMGVPVLGICLGMQVMNVEAGGTLIQDVADEAPGAARHTAKDLSVQHEVALVEGTKLARLAPSNRVVITSSHHQAVHKVPDTFHIAAKSEDGIIEAIERADQPFHMGVQWHPERNLEQPDWLLQAFVAHCAGH